MSLVKEEPRICAGSTLVVLQVIWQKKNSRKLSLRNLVPLAWLSQQLQPLDLTKEDE